MNPYLIFCLWIVRAFVVGLLYDCSPSRNASHSMRPLSTCVILLLWPVVLVGVALCIGQFIIDDWEGTKP